MPFGKHRGLPLSEVPGDYLDWLLTIELRPLLRKAVEDEVQRRITPVETMPCKVVDQWYRQAAVQFHPDRGGGTRDMQVVNACKDLLEQVIHGSAQR